MFNERADLVPAKSLLSKRKTLKSSNDLVDFKDVIDLSTPIVNFETFTAGKILGSTMTVTNKTGRDLLVQIAVDTETDQYPVSSREILSRFFEEDLPFAGSHDELTTNSEKEFGCWFLENPASKELVKSFVLKLGAFET